MGKFVLQILKSKKKIIAISIILVLIVPVLLGACLYYLTIDDASWKEAEYSSTPYAASTYTSKATVGTNGIAVSETAQQLWDKMIKEGSNVNDYLEGPEELEKLMNAEIITQYPKIGAGELDGIIQFKRKTSDGTEKTLSYKTQEQFNAVIEKYISEGNEDALNYYSLDDEGNALVAICTEIVTDTDGQVSTVRNMTTSKVPYKQMVSQYTMPFDYLWTWLVITEDKDFIFSLVDLIQNSEIVIGICDNSTISESVTVKKHTVEKRTDTFVAVKSELDYGVNNYPNKRSWLPEDSEKYEGFNADYEFKDYSSTTKITTTTTNIKFDIIKANTWIIDYSKDYSYAQPTLSDPIVNKVELDDTEYEPLDSNPNILQGQSMYENRHAQSLRLEAINYIKSNMPKEENVEEETTQDLPQPSPRLTQEEINRGDYTPKNENIIDVLITEVKCNYYTRKINQTEENTFKTTTQQYTEALPTTNPKVDRDSEENNFVKLFSKSKKARSNLDGIEDWLFEALESNTNLDAKWIDITKYLLQISTGKDYGIKDFNFDEYGASNFNIVSVGGNILFEYLSSWENGIIKQYINGKSSYSDDVAKYITQDKTKYICYTDKDGTRNFGFGVCHTANAGEDYWHVQEYQEEGINIESGSYDEIGVSQLDVDIVNNVKKQLLNSYKNSVINTLTSGGIIDEFSEEQINSLTCIMYQYGNIGNFVDVYKKYGNTIELINMVKSDSGKTYFNSNVESNGRSQANWKLFHEGIYQSGTGEILNPANYGSGDLLEVATAIWQKVCTSGKYTTYGGAAGIPVPGPSIDCSAFVSWILYEYGYSEEFYYQHNTEVLYNTNWKQKYGWEEISVGSGENPKDILLPGDIFVRYGGGTHHVTFVVEITNDGKLLAYDCGNENASWNGTSGAPVNKTYFLTESGPGKIIRVKDK